MFKNLPIRYKLLLYYSIVFTISLSLGSLFIYGRIQKTITANIENELEKTTQGILNMVKTAADVAIKNHLRGISEKNLEIARYFYRQYQQGQISETRAQQAAADLFLSQTIGKSGYIYCVDSSGTVLIHPENELIGVNVVEHEFVRRQTRQKKGYLEYQWKNPGETEPRPKALYMTYFEPWDWIISVTSYRREFKDVVNVNDFKEAVLNFHFGQTGYSFVIDNQGIAVIHPKLQDVNIFEDKSLPDRYLRSMWREKKGKITYPWKNPGETRQREKLVIFNYIPEYEWIVGSSSYLDEFYRPLTHIRNIMLLTAATTFVLIIFLTFKISESITKPLKKLMRYFHRTRVAHFTLRMQYDSKDEIGQLAFYYNDFMDQLQRYSNDLNVEIQNRRRMENELRKSEGRYRSVMEAAPDPIVVFDMKGEVIFFNPAFTRVLGWSLEEAVGRRLDHFVPEENWPETRGMIETILSGKTLPMTETSCYNKRGDIIPVTISGATYKDLDGRLAGTVVILRDITNAKRLRKQIMDISERERQKFGQNLHDDLGPHLIGIQGLCTVLEANLAEEGSQQRRLAEQITSLIENAIEKTRALARDLCPVHIVSHGFTTALEDLAERTEGTCGIRCRFEGDETIDLLDTTTVTNLYFSAQEAVSNAVKHSQASEIEIGLSRKKGKLHLTVADNGCGFEKTATSKGIGLQIMLYRTQMIGAVMRVDSRIGHGTTLTFILKKQAAAADRKELSHVS